MSEALPSKETPILAPKEKPSTPDTKTTQAAIDDVAKMSNI